MCLFTTNPILFKIKYINKDRYETARNASGVIGQAFHKAMEVYWRGNEDLIPRDESDAIKMGLETGMDFIDKYEEGWINWTSSIANKQKMFDMFSFGFNSYVKEKSWDEKEQTLACELEIESLVDIEWKGERINLPIALKGYIDRVVRTDKGIVIKDYKSCRSFSDPEKIDGKKIIQSITYFFLVYAFYGEAPYSIIFEEAKNSKNRDNGKQVREYEIIYSEHNLFFDFFLRLYQDIIRSLSGESVFVPNVDSFYDNEVAIISYIHRLDMNDEQRRLMKKYNVDNLTDLLEKKIQSAGNMDKLMKTIETKFISAKNLNYESMKNEQKIATKMMEHGMMIQFDSIVEGATVDLYKYIPSIGLKMSRILTYIKDIEQVLGVSGIRVLAPIPNSTMIGFEIPKEKRYFPALPDHNKTFEIAIGQDIFGETKRFDIREAPHILVAGATGSGKSVFLNSLIEQISQIENSEIHLFDPKVVELSFYEDIATEYKSDHREIHSALEDLVIEMEIRYQALKKAKKRSIKDMPNMKYKFIFIDEFGDLIMNAKVEESVLMLAQKARAAGIHLIVATQRPSTDVIKGTIKANFPTKVMFRTAKEIDSRVMLDQSGAEKLLGKGDMLFSSELGIERLQGFNI